MMNLTKKYGCNSPMDIVSTVSHIRTRGLIPTLTAPSYKNELYGLIKASRKWWKKFKEVMIYIDYVPSPADPCLFINTSTNHLLSFMCMMVVSSALRRTFIH
jgi:hypothetical protein